MSPVPEGGEQGEAPGESEAHARRAAALRGAERVLARHSMDATLQERLAALPAQAASVYDLAEPVDVYGNGVVEALEDRVADALGTEAAAFFPTGTMAQQVALRCWAGRSGNNTVALHPLSHPEVHEGGALGSVSGLRTVHPTRERRLPTAAEVRDFPEPFGTLMLELPLRDAGFTLPTWEELTEVVAAARERDAVVHLDGARLWECTTHFGRPLQEIAALADTVYVSFYKSLEGIGGAALAGPAELVEEARTWRHRYGGQVFQQFPTALAALHGLETVLPLLPPTWPRPRRSPRRSAPGSPRPPAVVPAPPPAGPHPPVPGLAAVRGEGAGRGRHGAGRGDGHGPVPPLDAGGRAGRLDGRGDGGGAGAGVVAGGGRRGRRGVRAAGVGGVSRG
ncbi:threonine aldolase family protein [Actinomadura keratinilytica]